MGEKKIPLRMCTGCREMKPKRELIRIVRTAEGELRIDATGKLNGRGAYLCRNAACLKKAQKSGAISRAFGLPVTEELFCKIETELKNCDP